jgi:hypothetical protein
LNRRLGTLPWDLGLLAATFLLALLPGAVSRAAAGFALTLFFPGYALLGCLRTPTRPTSLADLLHCGAASLAVTPLALRLAGLLVPFRRASILGLLLALPAFFLLLGALRPRAAARPGWRMTPPAFIAILILTVLLLVPTLFISSTPDGGETRIKGWDLDNHLAIAEAVSTRGLPPINPFLESRSPFYYHTFFHILLGAILVLTGPGAHGYLLMACLAVLLAAIFLGIFYRVVAELTGRDRVALLALPFVTFVGGFDAPALLGRALLAGERGSLPDLVLRQWNVDGWTSKREILVPTFFAGYYWAPHALAALIVFLLALLFLRKSETGFGAVGLAGACLASMAGYNGYVALGGAATLAILRGADFLRALSGASRHGREALLRSGLAGGTAVVLGWPVLSLYLGERGDQEKFRWAHPGPLLPVRIFLEFGPALLLGAAGLLRVWRARDLRLALMPFLCMGGVSLMILCCVVSTGENNDLAMRISMFSWIALAALGGFALDRIYPADRATTGGSRAARLAAGALLALGTASVVWFVLGASIAKPTLPADEVAAGRWIRYHIAPGRIVQGSPLRSSPDLVYLGGHPAALSDSWAGRLFYSDPGDFSRCMADLTQAFSTPDPAVACPTLQSLGVAALVIGPEEKAAFPLLARPLPWSCLESAFEQGSYRIFRLRPPIPLAS